MLHVYGQQENLSEDEIKRENKYDKGNLFGYIVDKHQELNTYYLKWPITKLIIIKIWGFLLNQPYHFLNTITYILNKPSTRLGFINRNFKDINNSSALKIVYC